MSIPDGVRGARHIVDFCNLVPLIGRRDLVGLVPKDRQRLRLMVAKADAHPEIVLGIDGAGEGLTRVALAIA
ncbi:hypothetical protein [Agromyces bauzanensis]|uniref:hypothetical protein n=1 Tax=Agromyces bauzanensis TaxID=1308924 RepID=UPI00166D84CA|nr:hypothetical protein [Agromyces bauzanensis]